MAFDFEQRFDYENGFYLTAPIERIGKFASHLELYRRIANMPGDVVECGVFKGASLSRFAKFRNLFENSASRRVVGFDVFDRFPAAEFEPDQVMREKFVAAAGEESVSVEQMRAYLDMAGVNQNVDLVAGDVRETIPAYLEQRPALRIALLHIDVDLYEATKACLELLYSCVVRGGIVILDDYGAFPGANRAIEEYFSDGTPRPSKLPYSHAISFIEKP